VIQKEFKFSSRKELDEILDFLLGNNTNDIYTVAIYPGRVVADLEKDLDVTYTSDDIFVELRTKEVEPFNYDGAFSIDVIFAAMERIKKDSLVPGYFVMNPEAFIKQTPHWACAVVHTFLGTTFMGMIVHETSELDTGSLVLVGCSGETPKAFNIRKAIKVTNNV